MLKLYTARNSICTQKVFITLAAKGIGYEMHNIDLFRNEQFRPEYLAINPKGVVPALMHADRIVTESTLICEYLDDSWPSPRLIPDDAYLRTKMRKWSKIVDEGIFEATREISFSAMFREKMRNMTPEQREGRFRNVGDPGKRMRFMSTYAEGVASPFVLQGVAAFEVAFGEMEGALGGTGPDRAWLVGDGMTLADINMMPFVARLAYLGLLDIWTSRRPRVEAWWARVQALKPFQVSVPDMLTAEEMATMATSGGRIRNEVQECYAAHIATLRSL